MPKRSYLALAEHLADCQELVRWIKSNPSESITVVSLGLDAKQFFDTHLENSGDKFKHHHVWSIVDMDQILNDSYCLSQNTLRDFSSPQGDLSSAIIYELDNHFLYHYLVSVRVVRAVFNYFDTIGVDLLLPPLRIIPSTSFWKDVQRNGRNNFIFKAVVSEITKKSQRQLVYTTGSIGKFQAAVLPIVLFCHVLWGFFLNIFFYIFDRLLWKKSMAEILKKIKSPKHIVISGWGANLSRFFSYDIVQEKIKKAGFSCLNIVWRPAKTRDFKPSMGVDDYIILREDLRRGVSYGPALSMFSLTEIVRIISDFFTSFRIVKHLFFTLLRGEIFDTLRESKAVRANFLFLLFYSYRSAFLADRLMSLVWRKFHPQIFVGADSGAPSSRSEIISAKINAIRTISVPHSYAVYKMADYHFLADVVAVSGIGVVQTFNDMAILDKKIVPIGINMPSLSIPKKHFSPHTVVIATRSRGGMWSNFSSRHDLYDLAIKDLLRLIASNTRLNTIVKPHPNGDFQDYYLDIVKRGAYPQTQCIVGSWKLAEFAENCDILVCMGEATSYLVTAIAWDIPVVFVTGTMGSVLKSLHYYTEGCAVVVKTVEEAVLAIEHLASDKQYYDRVVKRQSDYKQKYIHSEQSEELFTQMLFQEI